MISNNGVYSLFSVDQEVRIMLIHVANKSSAKDAFDCTFYPLLSAIYLGFLT